MGAQNTHVESRVHQWTSSPLEARVTISLTILGSAWDATRFKAYTSDVCPSSASTVHLLHSNLSRFALRLGGLEIIKAFFFFGGGGFVMVGAVARGRRTCSAAIIRPKKRTAVLEGSRSVTAVARSRRHHLAHNVWARG
jgi:hypothetical protein